MRQTGDRRCETEGDVRQDTKPPNRRHETVEGDVRQYLDVRQETEVVRQETLNTDLGDVKQEL